MEYEVLDALEGNGGQTCGEDLYWVTPEYLGVEYDRVKAFYDELRACSKPRLIDRISDKQICSYIWNSGQAPTKPEVPHAHWGRGSARYNVMWALINSCVAAYELYSGHSIYWYQYSVDQKHMDAQFDRNRIRTVYPMYGSSLRNARNQYLEGAFNIGDLATENP